MKPDELAKYRAAKLAKKRAAEDQKISDEAAARAKIAEQNKIAENALENALPYLSQTRTALGTAFQFVIARDATTKAAGISLTLGDASAQIKKSPLGVISTIITEKLQVSCTRFC